VTRDIAVLVVQLTPHGVLGITSGAQTNCDSECETFSLLAPERAEGETE